MGSDILTHSSQHRSLEVPIIEDSPSMDDESGITTESASYSKPSVVIFKDAAQECSIAENGALNTVDETIIAVPSLIASRETAIGNDFSPSSHDPQSMVRKWDGRTYLSDMIRNGLDYLKRDSSNVLMIYESPSSSTKEGSFFNR
jgi:hypothetical protein